MARLTDSQWELARADYEVRGFSYSELTKKYGMGKSTLSDRVKKEGWQQGKTEHLVQRKVNAIRELHETEQQTERLPATEQLSIDQEVAVRLSREKIFVDSALMNQNYANELLENIDIAEMKDLKAHADLTAKNKETVLGKQPDTAIQINNNGASVIDELVAKRV